MQGFRRRWRSTRRSKPPTNCRRRTRGASSTGSWGGSFERTSSGSRCPPESRAARGRSVLRLLGSRAIIVGLALLQALLELLGRLPQGARELWEPLRAEEQEDDPQHHQPLGSRWHVLAFRR